MKILLKMFGFLTLGMLFLLSCQQNPLEPRLEEASSLTFRTVQINPAKIGLAKISLNDTQFINRSHGGTLGGSSTDGNYVEIPGFALKKSLNLSFTLIREDDGSLIYEVHPVNNEQNWYNEDKSSTLYVLKDWLTEKPDCVKHQESGEIVSGVEDAGKYWKVSVPHFSQWAWGVLE